MAEQGRWGQGVSRWQSWLLARGPYPLKLHDALELGVPQDLERILILGLLDEGHHLALEGIHIPWGLLQDCSRQELINT
jgi:hypothetical protein